MQEEEADYYAESDVSEGAMLRAKELVNSDLFDALAREEHADAPLDPRPRIANPVRARFMSVFSHGELGSIDALLQRDERRQELHQQQHEAEQQQKQRQEEASASGYLPSGETPDVLQEQEMKEEESAAQEMQDLSRRTRKQEKCRYFCSTFLC